VAPIGAALAILGIWWVVAHNGGSGWVQALGDVVFGALVVGIFGPAVVLACAKVHVADAPADGVAGTAIDLRLEASTRLRIRPVTPPGREAFVGPVGRSHTAEDRVSLLPVGRGVHQTVWLDIATAAPFALQWWTRRIELPLPGALHVAPRKGRPHPLPFRQHEEDGASFEWTLADTGQTRGARPYRPGDSQRHVHWRATAHSGELMVRERERPTAEPITIRVVLPSDPQEAERLAERALGTVVQLLERGAPVLLATVELSGPIVGKVTERRGAGRRLARAVGRSRSTGSPWE
jgi:uncharacterized protein (DUF58 family)